MAYFLTIHIVFCSDSFPVDGHIALTRIDIIYGREQYDSMTHIDPEEQERLLNQSKSICLRSIANSTDNCEFFKFTLNSI